MPLFSKKMAPTQVTSDLEKLTRNDNQELDWGLFYQVCEKVHSSPLAAKESRKLLQKKMVSDDPRTQTLALEVLNALSENASDTFKNQLAAKSFGDALETLATHKAWNDQVHSKLVQCLQNWVSHFGSDPAFGTICRVHELVMHGPSHSIKSGGGRLGGNFFKPYQLPPSMTMTSRSNPLPTPQMNGGGYQQLPRRLPAHDIMSDVEIAKNNALLFSQTLSFTDPIQEDIKKNELIQEFFAKCKGLQRLITDHLQTCEDPDKISALILANGELVSTFKTYDDMLDRRALDAATSNSRAVNHRATRQDETLINTETGTPGTDPHVGTSTSACGSSSSNSRGVGGGFGYVSSAEPSRGFHMNEQKSLSSASGYHGSALPLPLTPQKLHD